MGFRLKNGWELGFGTPLQDPLLRPFHKLPTPPGLTLFLRLPNSRLSQPMPTDKNKHMLHFQSGD